MAGSRAEEERAERVLDVLTTSKYAEGIEGQSVRISNKDRSLNIFLMTKTGVDIEDTKLYQFLKLSLDKVHAKSSTVKELEDNGIKTNLKNPCFAIVLSTEDLKKLDPGAPVEEVKEKAKQEGTKDEAKGDDTRSWIAAKKTTPRSSTARSGLLGRHTIEEEPGQRSSRSSSGGEKDKPDSRRSSGEEKGIKSPRK